MSAPHPGAEALELYVVGAHDQIAVREVEAHLRGCESCTDEVRRQAQVELAMAEVAEEAAFCPGCGAVLIAARCPQCGAVADVGGFRVERVIVQNARGRMYLARDREGQPVALKELAFVQAPHPEALEAFEREARLLRQLSHPQIPRFLASFRDGEGVSTRLYLAQEYVEGESLLARLGRHQFSEEEATEVAVQVLAIVEYLQGLAPMVFHRDIKPANLIRRPDGRIALVDFGAARDLGPTVGATLVGTFGYMPVEQMGGIVDATTDLYALGATLSHLLSRREPWSFLQDPGALARLNVSPGFRDWLGTLMARRATDRYPSAVAAAVALRAPRPRRRPQIAMPRAPSPVRIGIFFSLLLTVVGAGFLFVARARRPPRVREVLSRFELVPKGSSPTEPQLMINPRHDSHRVQIPAELAGAAKPRAVAKVCVSEKGDVTNVSIVESAHPLLDPQIRDRLLQWKYRPHLVEGRPQPFCTHESYEMGQK